MRTKPIPISLTQSGQTEVEMDGGNPDPKNGQPPVEENVLKETTKDSSLNPNALIPEFDDDKSPEYEVTESEISTKLEENKPQKPTYDNLTVLPSVEESFWMPRTTPYSTPVDEKENQKITLPPGDALDLSAKPEMLDLPSKHEEALPFWDLDGNDCHPSFPFLDNMTTGAEADEDEDEEEEEEEDEEEILDEILEEEDDECEYDEEEESREVDESLLKTIDTSAVKIEATQSMNTPVNQDSPKSIVHALPSLHDPILQFNMKHPLPFNGNESAGPHLPRPYHTPSPYPPQYMYGAGRYSSGSTGSYPGPLSVVASSPGGHQSFPSGHMISPPSGGHSMHLDLSAFGLAEQNMVCMVCKKSFRFEKNLLRHMQKAHSTGEGESVLKCKLCNYTTKHYSNMYVHIRTHTGDKPYWCSACGAAFTQGSSLKLHIKSRHNDNNRFFSLTKKPGKNNLTKLWTRVLKKDLPKYNSAAAGSLGLYASMHGHHNPTGHGLPFGMMDVGRLGHPQTNSYLGNPFNGARNYYSGLQGFPPPSNGPQPQFNGFNMPFTSFLDSSAVHHLPLPRIPLPGDGTSPSATGVKRSNASSPTSLETKRMALGTGSSPTSTLPVDSASPKVPTSSSLPKMNPVMSDSLPTYINETAQENNPEFNGFVAPLPPPFSQQTSSQSFSPGVSPGSTASTGLSNLAVSFTSHFHKVGISLEKLEKGKGNVEGNFDLEQYQQSKLNESADEHNEGNENISTEKTSTAKIPQNDSKKQTEGKDHNENDNKYSTTFLENNNNNNDTTIPKSDSSAVKELSAKLEQLRETASAFIMQLYMRNPGLIWEFESVGMGDLLRQLGGNSLPLRQLQNSQSQKIVTSSARATNGGFSSVGLSRQVVTSPSSKKEQQCPTVPLGFDADRFLPRMHHFSKGHLQPLMTSGSHGSNGSTLNGSVPQAALPGFPHLPLGMSHHPSIMGASHPPLGLLNSTPPTLRS